MKLKFKLNLASIKALALQHGEKAGFALGIGVLVMFIWSAAKTEVLGPDKQPLKLEEAANKTDDHIKNSKWDPAAKGIEVVDYVRRAKRDPLNDKEYRLATFWTRPLWETKGKRPDPKLLPVEEMQASAGLGILALNNDLSPQASGLPPRKLNGPPGGPPGPRAGVPGKKDKDKPTGPGPAAPPRGPKPSRQQDGIVPPGARVNVSTELKGFSWVVVTGLVPGRKQEAEFEEAFLNVIKPIPEADTPEYEGMKIERAEIRGDAAPVWQEIKLKDVKAFKLKWQGEAPEVVDDAYYNSMYTQALAPLVGVNWDPAAVGHPKVPLTEKLGMAGQQIPVTSEEDDEEDDDTLEVRGQRKEPARIATPSPLPGRAKKTRDGTIARRQADVTLFRFTDFSVEPGRRYSYRVKLKLANPNFGVTERYLKDPNSKTQKSLYSPWSEPTPVVAVPRDVEVFAGPVVKPSAKEPFMKGMVTKLDRQHGIRLVGEEIIQRGTLFNIRKKIETEPKPGGEPETIDALLDADSVIVDIVGGKPFRGPKSLTVPGEMVILQPDGSLEVRDEFDDEPTYHKNLPSDDLPAAGGGAGGLLSSNPYDTFPKGDGKPKKKKRDLKAENEAKKQKAKASK